MTTKTLYTCEICHTDYADEKKALACEKNHKLLNTAEIEAVYTPISSDKTGVPNKIKVKFAGMKDYVVYKR